MSTTWTVDRETIYGMTGGNGTTTRYPNGAGNSSELVSVTGATPDGAIQIPILGGEGPNNNHANGFICLGVLEIESVPVPGPSTLVLSDLGLLTLAAFRRRSRAFHASPAA